MEEETGRRRGRIIVAEEKHATRYLEATTDEDWARNALALLTQRFRSGNWYYDPFEDMNEYSVRSRNKRQQLLGMTKEKIDALPLLVQEDLRKKIKEAVADFQEDERVRADYLEIKRAVETQDLSWWGKGRMARPVVWDLLTRRSDHEYEHVELESVEVLAGDFAGLELPQIS